MDSKNIGINLLRYSLAFVFLWFGFSQISDITSWIPFVPENLANIMNPAILVFINGVFEMIAGMLIALGVLVRPLAFILGAHLFFIAISIGLTSVGVRDIGLALAAVSLGFIFRRENINIFKSQAEE